MSFFDELKRRNVFKVGIAYLVGSWLLIQIADILLDNIGAPAWVLQTLFVVIGVGFFISMFFAWAFEMTPEGVKREKDVDRGQSVTHQTGKKLNTMIMLMMALAISYLLFDKFSSPKPDATPASSVEQLAKAAPGQDSQNPADETKATIKQQSIAVLPFDNRSRDADDEFFVEGIHDDLLTNLARIGSLKVISRTSVMRYKDTEIPIPEIARELGVATIMEGAVQRSGSTVRINVQLIDAKTDEHLWAEIYDRKLSAENLFSIQSEISQAIADALEAALSPEEQKRINTVPTENLAAYDAYLRGRQLMATRDSDKLKRATEAFTTAVEFDPQFALAWVNLADSTMLLTQYGTLNPDIATPIREKAVERALVLDNQLGEAYASQAQVYDDSFRYEQAEVAYKKAIELSPNYATAYHWYSILIGRFPLRVQQNIDLAKKAAELDPGSSIIGVNLAGAYWNQGLYSLAQRQFQKTLELDPGFTTAVRSLAGINVFSLGRFDKGVQFARQAVEMDPGNIQNLAVLASAYEQLRDTQAFDATLQEMESLDAGHAQTAFMNVISSLRNDNPAGTREAINWALPKLKHNPFLTNILADFELIGRDTQRARDIYLTVSPGWLEPDEWEQLISEFTSQACVVSWLLINTGDENLGADLLAQTTEYLDEALPAVMEDPDSFAPEVCYLTAGDTEKALVSLETQLAHNHLFGWDIGQKFPWYDLIRDEPRFQAMLAERDRRIEEQRKALAQMDAETAP